MRQLSRIECFAVGCNNEASVSINGDHMCIYCARADLDNAQLASIIAEQKANLKPNQPDDLEF